MGMVASYARMDAEEIEELRDDPDSYWKLQDSWASVQNPDFAELVCLYIDKEWRNLSWLCSSTGRVEERNEAAFMRVSDRKFRGEDLSHDQAFRAALAEEAAALGFTYIPPEELPEDLVLQAIQGRRGDDQGPTIDDLGAMASVWEPDEVRALSEALANVTEAELRERFDVNEMEVLDLPGDWQQSDLDEFILPQFRRLRAFYERAVSEGQHVVVVLG